MFIDFMKGKNDFGRFDIISCLLAGQFPDFKYWAWKSLFVYAVSNTGLLNVLWFDLRLPQGQFAYSRILKRWRYIILNWREPVGGLCGKRKLSKGFGRVLKLYVTFVDKIEYAQVQLVVRTSVFAHKQNNEVQNICQDDDVGCLVPEIFDQWWHFWPLTITINRCRMQLDVEVMQALCDRHHQGTVRNYGRDVHHMPVSLHMSLCRPFYEPSRFPAVVHMYLELYLETGKLPVRLQTC